jgi:hypothetical protein
MKVRATYTVVKDYEVNLENYPEGTTFPDGVIKLDQKIIMEDPELFFSDVDSDHLDLKVVED